MKLRVWLGTFIPNRSSGDILFYSITQFKIIMLNNNYVMAIIPPVLGSSIVF